jgi:catechol 2,3-dioxygenase-like lactoylglutathione lyase family enzyme
MTDLPSGREVLRAFLPTKDFDASRRFYEALGFECLLDVDVAIFKLGGGGFILQRHYQKEWAENSMMQMMVDDLDAWWAHIQKLELPAAFGVAQPRAPALQPWGLRVAYVVDPCGVLWHFAERRAGMGHD